MKSFVFRSLYILFFVILVFLFAFLVLGQGNKNNPPSALNYAPNFQFDPEEEYYPADPLDFYFENGEEVEGEKARAKYYKLSFSDKIKNFVVFYHIEDEGGHWVYQYWIFCVFNDNLVGVKNKHYGDWEAVFVFVDKESGQVIRVVGTAHQRKIFDTEIVNPKTNHIWAYVANGSHAICVDEENDEKCDFKRWRKLERWDKDGYVALYTRYKLKEITQEYIDKFNGKTSFTKSPVLGIDFSDIITFGGENKNEFNPADFDLTKGGGTPFFAWHQLEYHNPKEARPRDVGYAVEIASNKVNQIKNRVTKFFGGLTARLTNFFKKPKEFQANISRLSSKKPVSETPQESPDLKESTPSVPESKTPEESTPDKEEKPTAPELITELIPELIQEQKEGTTAIEASFPDKPKTIEPKSTPEPQTATERESVSEKEESTKEAEQNQSIVQSQPPLGLPFFIGGGSPPEAETETETATTTSAFISLPKIISPSSGTLLGQSDDFSTSTDGFQINLIGTSTPDYSILIFINSTSTIPDYSTITDSNGDWSEIITLQEGKNTIKVKAKDADNNQSQETSLSLTLDITPPSKIIDLSAESGNQRGQVRLSWSAPGDDESTGTSSQYIIKYATSSEITSANWDSAVEITSEPMPSIASTTENFTISSLNPGQTYYFAIQTKDKAGNLSEISNSTSTTASALAEYVVINEVQIADNEFVELYNPTNQDIDMTGWYWSYYPSNRDWNNPYRNKEFPAGAVIPAHGFYLVGLAGYPESGSYLDADWQVYSSSQLNSQAGSVAVFPWDPTATSTEKAQAGCIDVISWGEVDYVYETASALVPGQDNSLARQPNGWDTDNNSHDFIEDDWPTPKNSQGETVTIVPDNTRITQDTVWTADRSPYILESNAGTDQPTVEKGAVLTIEPGVVIKGANKYYPSLVIKGGLKAQGTAVNPVVFTAATTTPQAGDWSGVVFDNSTSTESLLEYVTFEYGGYQTSYQGSQISEMLRINNSQVTIENSTFKQSQHNGVYLMNSDFSIDDSIFENNASAGLIISGTDSQGKINNCQFNNNSTGLEVIDQASPEIDSNLFSGNNQAIALRSAYPMVNNNQADDNNLNGIVVDQESVFSQDTTWTNNFPYILYSGKSDYPSVASSTRLTLEAGVIIKPANKYYTALLIEGELITQGTTSTPIVFTSLKDDDYGGDTNNDGTFTFPTSGDWKDIRFAAGSRGSLDHIRFRYSSGSALNIDPQSSVTQGSDIVYGP